MEWDYLSFRLWIGIWIGVILFILVATDASFTVCYITRFTEENFATLIAVIFIIKAIDKVLSIEDKYPIHESPCYCQPSNLSEIPGWNMSWSMIAPGNPEADGKNCIIQRRLNNIPSEVHGETSIGCHYVPNAFLMSVLIFCGTYLISSNLKSFKFTN